MQLIVHGGAGDEPDEPDRRQSVLDEAAAIGADATTPVDAVVSAIDILEADPRFNAGVGGAIQADGVVRTDAGIMTDERRAGAACSMPGVRHAIGVAHRVMEETPHVLLAGEHAVALAEGFDIVPEELTTDHTRERFAAADPPETDEIGDRIEWVRERFGGADTVGAVAVDEGRVAAATSTGGRWFALAGRVGDVPQIGCGFYASPAGGASATGAGEDIARTTLAREAVRRLEDGEQPTNAAANAIDEYEELTGSTAGVIVLDESGQAGSAYNSAAMQTSTDL
ncbi:isoaspartyl peptidase/L-asparaginase [Halococcus dombrowskii]|uniref:Plant-type L-asparaginase n=1 Tax=Halococcus dombrowskii TaxID=179637 RepID=A0AAV3SHV4_HALDO|nr:isoaspartyl peptidase/L-asparaginase [Halococcus dombrowskii]UOO94819.1 isoaspartyl peptidase/L-asparaginase [Halococcus dombrowskii]